MDRDPKDFRNQPRPEDWVLPAEVLESFTAYENPLDPVTISILKEKDYEGVPIPLILQVVQEFKDQFTRLDEGEEPATIAEKMIAGMAGREARYPDTGMWDRVRTAAMSLFVGHDHLDQALALATTVKETRMVVSAILSNESLDDETAAGWVMQLADQSPERALSVSRAIRDHLVDTEPGNPVIDTYNGIILRQTGQTDWVHDWIESQRRRGYEDVWDVVEGMLHDEETYEGMPITFRMYSQLRFMEMIEKISAGDLSESFVQNVLDYYKSAETSAFSEAPIWGNEKAVIVKRLLEENHIDAAVEIAAAIRDQELVAYIVQEFVGAEQEEAAAELAVRITDHKLSAEMLLDGEWQNTEISLGRFIEIIQSDEYPPEKRIAFLEVVRDRMIEAGSPEKAAEYQHRIDEIKEKAE